MTDLSPHTLGDLTADALGMKVTVMSREFVLAKITHFADISTQMAWTELNDERSYPSSLPIVELRESG